MDTPTPEIWLFAYGSLIWNTGFRYEESFKATTPGYARRMYQGNVYHRGTKSRPGRVATLIKDPNSSTTGLVFRILGEEDIQVALVHLRERELTNGYQFQWISVHSEGIELTALTCIAVKQNDYYLGSEELDVMAEEISRTRGLAGPNYEYVLKLADRLRRLFPEKEDEHLFGLERRIRQILASGCSL